MVQPRRAATLPDDDTSMNSKIKTTERRLTTPEKPDEHDAVHSKLPDQTLVPTLHLTEGEIEAFRHLAWSIVSRTLAHECEYRHLGCPEPNAKEWRLFKRQQDLRVYKQRGQKSDISSKSSSVLCVGSLEGSLEDVLYGMHSKTRDEMHVTASYLRSSHYIDCAVLDTLEIGSHEDPYRQLTLRWFISKTFGDARLINYRDFFDIESIGIGHDAWGQRYGYFLSRFTEHPGCPAMPHDCDVVRGKMFMCCIYRQEFESPVVNVYAKGSFDLGGDIPSFINIGAACAMMFSIAASMESAEGKRLTKLALQHKDRRQRDEEEKSEAESKYFDKFTTDSVVDLLSSSLLSTECCDDAVPTESREPCHVCGRNSTLSRLVRCQRKCGICKERTCSKCCTKRKLFGQAGPVSVACCKSCILESKNLQIDPREPCPVLV